MSANRNRRARNQERQNKLQPHWDVLREQMTDLDWDISDVGNVQEALAAILGVPGPDDA